LLAGLQKLFAKLGSRASRRIGRERRAAEDKCGDSAEFEAGGEQAGGDHYGALRKRGRRAKAEDDD
jgi:hypothetical protein